MGVGCLHVMTEVGAETGPISVVGPLLLLLYMRLLGRKYDMNMCFFSYVSDNKTYGGDA